MAAKDFSRGIPRFGQWCIWQGRPVVATTKTSLGPDGIVISEPWPYGMAWIELLDTDGCKAEGQVLVSIDALIPITSRDQVPAKRLALGSKDWQPRP